MKSLSPKNAKLGHVVKILKDATLRLSVPADLVQRVPHLEVEGKRSGLASTDPLYM